MTTATKKKKKKNRGTMKQWVSAELTHRSQCCTYHLQGKRDWQPTPPLPHPEKGNTLAQQAGNGQAKHKDYEVPCTWIVWASKRFQISPKYHGKSSISFNEQKREIVEIFCSRHDSNCGASQTQNELKRNPLATYIGNLDKSPMHTYTQLWKNKFAF